MVKCVKYCSSTTSVHKMLAYTHGEKWYFLHKLISSPLNDKLQIKWTPLHKITSVHCYKFCTKWNLALNLSVLQQNLSLSAPIFLHCQYNWPISKQIALTLNLYRVVKDKWTQFCNLRRSSECSKNLLGLTEFPDTSVASYHASVPRKQFFEIRFINRPLIYWLFHQNV